MSTAAWHLLTELSDPAGGNISTPTRWGEAPAWLLIWLSGTSYAALVLWRHLYPQGARRRPAALLFGGALSYWIGVQYAAVLRPGPGMILDTATAGVITAAFVGYITIRLGTPGFACPQFAVLCLAGGVGGAAIGWSVSHNQALSRGLIQVGLRLPTGRAAAVDSQSRGAARTP